MKIYLKDSIKNQIIHIDLTVEYSTQCHDIYVLFLGEEQNCRLLNGKDSAPYVEYTYKKLNHIVCGNIRYKNILYTLTLGFYTSFDQSNFSYVLLDQESDVSELRFSDMATGEQIFSRIFLVNYNEHKELSENLGFEKLSFKAYVEKIVSGEIDRADFTLYDIFPKQKKSPKEFITVKGFDIFLDEEEKRTAKIV